MSEEYRNIHVTVSEQNYQLLRRVAYENETTKSDMINVLIQEKLCKPEEPPVPPESTPRPEVPSPSAPTTWSVNTLRNR